MNKNDFPCIQCRLRARFDSNPKSLAGRFWHWHTGFCPGWKAFMKSLGDEERKHLTEKYSLKSK